MRVEAGFEPAGKVLAGDQLELDIIISGLSKSHNASSSSFLVF